MCLTQKWQWFVYSVVFVIDNNTIYQHNTLIKFIDNKPPNKFNWQPSKQKTITIKLKHKRENISGEQFN